MLRFLFILFAFSCVRRELLPAININIFSFEFCFLRCNTISASASRKPVGLASPRASFTPGTPLQSFKANRETVNAHWILELGMLADHWNWGMAADYWNWECSLITGTGNARWLRELGMLADYWNWECSLITGTGNARWSLELGMLADYGNWGMLADYWNWECSLILGNVGTECSLILGMLADYGN